jgi:hypothetical protein
MRYNAYILKTTVYRIKLTACSKAAAVRLVLEAVENDTAEYETETVDSWWDYESIAVEEAIPLQENIQLDGLELG